VPELASVEITRHADGAIYARLSGELDMASQPDVGRRLYEAVSRGASSLTIDMSELTFLDSAGVELLYRLREDFAARQMTLTLVIPPGTPVRRSIEVTDGTTGLLPVVDTA
jgi:anti-anti-sigma factor